MNVLRQSSTKAAASFWPGLLGTGRWSQILATAPMHHRTKRKEKTWVLNPSSTKLSFRRSLVVCDFFTDLPCHETWHHIYVNDIDVMDWALHHTKHWNGCEEIRLQLKEASKKHSEMFQHALKRANHLYPGFAVLWAKWIWTSVTSARPTSKNPRSLWERLGASKVKSAATDFNVTIRYN